MDLALGCAAPFVHSWTLKRASNPCLPCCPGLDEPWFEPVGSRKQPPLKLGAAVPLRGLVKEQILISKGNDTRRRKYSTLSIEMCVGAFRGREESWFLLRKVSLSFFKDFIYFQREGKGGRKKGRETLVSCLLHTPSWGPGPQSRRMPWLGIE